MAVREPTEIARAEDAPRSGETQEEVSERLDRELIELLNGLRVMLPGVQVMFAFLLTVPFAARFDRVTQEQRIVYYVALLAAALASVLLIAPSSYHRIRWRDRDKEQLLRTSNRLAIAGTVALAASLGCVVHLVSDVLFDEVVASSAAGAVLAAVAWLWYGLPLLRRLRDGDGAP